MFSGRGCLHLVLKDTGGTGTEGGGHTRGSVLSEQRWGQGEYMQAAFWGAAGQTWGTEDRAA
jgi:hypothetical protein